MKTIELSIKDLLVAVLRRWFPILLVGMILAGTGFVYGNYKYKQNAENIESFETEDTLLSFVQEENDLSKSIESASARINELSMEIEKTNTDLTEHREKYGQTAYVSFSVVVDNASMSVSDKFEATDRIIEQYLVLAKYASFKDIFAGKNYAIRKESELNAYVNVYKENEGTITIEAIRIVNDEGTILAGKILNYLRENQPAVAAATARHDIVVISSSVKNVLGLWASERERIYLERIERYEKAVSELESQLKSENERIMEIEKLRIEKASLLSNTQSGNNSIIFSVIVFFFAGVFVSAFIVIASYILKLNVFMPDQIKRQLGARYLGGVQRKHSYFSSGIVNRLSGQLLKTKEAEAIELIMANIREVKSICGKVLITGTVDESIITEFAKKIIAQNSNNETTFIYGGDANFAADTVYKLTEADCVVLVERLNVSRLRNVNRLIERVEGSGNKVLGYVVF